jgi:thymidylate synthase (FAD)
MINVDLVNYTPNPDITVTCAARVCIRDKSFQSISEEITKEDVERIIKKVIQKNHLSVLEHINFTFSISGVSRILTHQLVRHRIGSYSQLSQQHTDSSENEYSTPPEIQSDPELDKEYKEAVNNCQKLYKHLIRNGISRGSARYILPSCFSSRIMVTMNARSLFNLLSQRECRMEEWEFREVAYLIHVKLLEIAPVIFKHAGPPCKNRLTCPEGKVISECYPYLKINLTQSDQVKEPEYVQ